MTPLNTPEYCMPAIEETVTNLQDKFIVELTKSCFMKEAESLSSFKMELRHLPVNNQEPLEYILKMEERDRINTTEDVKEILGILTPYGDYLNYEFLEHIVKEFGTSELQQEMKEYIE